MMDDQQASEPAASEPIRQSSSPNQWHNGAQKLFHPRSGLIIIGMVVVAILISISVLMQSGSVGIIVATMASCFVVGTMLWINDSLRWEHAEHAYDKERTAAESWHDRCSRLLAETVRTDAVLAHMTDGIVLLSPASEILLINDAAKRLLAAPKSGTSRGRRFSELVRIPEIVHAVRRAQTGRFDQQLSVEIVDGSIVRPVSFRISRIPDGNPPHLLLVLRDETEAHRVEAVRREFIANVSHELKTPLAAIKGYAETVELAIEDDPESAKHFISQIDAQCQRLENLIADMLRLARAQSGRGMMKMQAIDLEAVIQQAMMSFLPVANAKKIVLQSLASETPVQVMADEEAALAIAQNLISNAIRHTESAGHVTVSCRPDGDGWILAVQDDGIGIAAEFQERIFERFYRVKQARKTADGGTGIGLSIVKNLTRAMGGTVSVTSKPGAGATFEVWLPKSR